MDDSGAVIIIMKDDNIHKTILDTWMSEDEVTIDDDHDTLNADEMLLLDRMEITASAASLSFLETNTIGVNDNDDRCNTTRIAVVSSVNNTTIQSSYSKNALTMSLNIGHDDEQHHNHDNNSITINNSDGDDDALPDPIEIAQLFCFLEGDDVDTNDNGMQGPSLDLDYNYEGDSLTIQNKNITNAMPSCNIENQNKRSYSNYNISTNDDDDQMIPFPVPKKQCFVQDSTTTTNKHSNDDDPLDWITTTTTSKPTTSPTSSASICALTTTPPLCLPRPIQRPNWTRPVCTFFNYFGAAQRQKQRQQEQDDEKENEWNVVTPKKRKKKDSRSKSTRKPNFGTPPSATPPAITRRREVAAAAVTAAAATAQVQAPSQATFLFPVCPCKLQHQVHYPNAIAPPVLKIMSTMSSNSSTVSLSSNAVVNETRSTSPMARVPSTPVTTSGTNQLREEEDLMMGMTCQPVSPSSSSSSSLTLSDSTCSTNS